MKLGYTFLVCGIILFLLSIFWIVAIFSANEDLLFFAIGRAIFSFFIGLSFMRIGAVKIVKARQQNAQMQLIAFQEANCMECRFAGTDDTGKLVCDCPNPPQYDGQRCYSREGPIGKVVVRKKRD